MTRPIYSGYRVGKPDGGPECEAFERELEAYYRVPYARVLNSATAALHAALTALNVRGGEVICPALTMSASAAAIVHAGARPVFCDITDGYTLDWQDARRRIGPNTRAILLVHLFGHHADVPGDIAVPVVHDCAQSPTVRPGAGAAASLSAASNSRATGDIWCYSLNQWKICTCGEGGYALYYNRMYGRTIHAMRNHGECYTEDIIGFNYRMTEMQAELARREFTQLDERIARRREWADSIRWRWHVDDPGNRDWFLFPVRVRPDEREATAARMGGRVGYHKPLYRLPWFAAHGYSDTILPNVERIESELVVLDPLAYE